VGIFFFVGAILLFKLPLALSSRLQPVHCPLPVFEGFQCPLEPLQPPELKRSGDRLLKGRSYRK